MATLIIKDKHSGKLALPHYLLINDQIVGVMKGEARVTVPAATFKVTDMVLWLVKRLLHLPEPWGLIYEILSNGFFAVWLLRVWIIRKKYFKVEVFQKIAKRENDKQ